MSFLDLVLLPVRIVRNVASAVAKGVTSTPPAAAELVVVNGMPEGVPSAALRPEPRLPAPAGWPFGEEFPRTCGTGRLAGGALFWTDFIYDDHGAAGVPVSLPAGGLAPPRGTYVYPPGPASNNGADIFRVAIGLTETDTWWRIDWNTLLDPSVPIGLFTFDTGRFDTDRAPGADGRWPAQAGVRSVGIDLALVISAAGARLIDMTSGSETAVEHAVDTAARSFIARVPRSSMEPTGTWKVRFAAGLANAAGDAFADVPAARGALPGQPNVYNVAFRTPQQETAYQNFWSENAQAAALKEGDVSQFSVEVVWEQLGARASSAEPIITGASTRWYVSSVELGQGVARTGLLATKPQFLGRVQPYSVCVPATYKPGQTLPLTLLLHSLALGQNQFAAIDPKLLHEVCDVRDSIVVTPLSRGPSGWYFDEAELDVWEVWARVAEQFATDPNRTVVGGYSMGGYGAYRLGLTYPEVFSQAVVLAGPPTCGVRLLPGVDIPAELDPRSHCAREGDTWPLLENGRWLPFVIAHGMLDELVPFTAALQQSLELDRLGYRYRFTAYPSEDHIAWMLKDKFEDAISHMGTDLRQADPGHISFSWYPQLVRSDLGIGPHRVWWLSELQADPRVMNKPGAIARVDARSYARPDPAHTTVRRRGVVVGGEPSPGLYTEQIWRIGRHPATMPYLTLDLVGVAAVTLDVARSGLAPLSSSTITLATDTAAQITLAALPPGTLVELDGKPVGVTVKVPPGRHQIALRTG